MDPYAKWLFFFGTKKGSSYSCPLDMTSSAVDSSKCPFQDRVLGGMHTKCLIKNSAKSPFQRKKKAPQNGRKMAQTGQKSAKMVKEGPKRSQKVVKTMLNDANAFSIENDQIHFRLYHPAIKLSWASYVPCTPTYGDASAHVMVAGLALCVYSL